MKLTLQIEDCLKKSDTIMRATRINDKDISCVKAIIRCKHVKDGLPVFFYENGRNKTVRVCLYFFFGIPSLAPFDEYELSKMFNGGIDCFKTIISSEMSKTRIEMRYDFPSSSKRQDVERSVLQVIERIPPSVDRFLSIYDDYISAINKKYKQMSDLNIVMLSQYRKGYPIY